MNWLSLDEEREGWKFFWHSILFPMYFWLFNIFFLLCVALFPNKYIFENTLSFIPYIISFRLGIIATFGALILTLYINVRTETKGWSNPKEYKYSFAYQKYAKLISYFLGMVWFMNFIYVAWRDANIPEGIKKVFLAGVWEDDSHGKFIGADVAVDSDIPLWVFLFLSWFVLSISVYMSNNEVSIHHTIMTAYKEIDALHRASNINSYNLSKKIIKIIKYMYDDNKNWAKIILKSEDTKDIWEEIYRIFPNTSTKGYHYLVNGLRPSKKKLFIKMFIIYGVIVALHVMLTIHVLVNVYHMNLSFGPANILSIVIISMLFYVLIILFWYNIFLDTLNTLMVHSKVVWVWVISILPGVFILMMMILVFLFNLLSVLYSYQGRGDDSDAGGLFQALLALVIGLAVLLFTCYMVLTLKHIDFMKEDHKRVVLKAIFGIDSETVNQSIYNTINTLIISRIIYLHVKAKSTYSKYLRSVGESKDILNGDLCRAYTIAKKDGGKFPRLINIFDIFS